MKHSEIHQRLQDAGSRAASGCHEESIALLSQCVQPLRDEIDGGGEETEQARHLLFSVLYAAGLSFFTMHDLTPAMGCFLQSLQLAQESENMRGIGAALHEMALISAHWGQYDKAATLSEGSIRATTSAGSEAVNAVQWLAVIYQLTGRFAEAERLLRLVRESCEARGDLIGLGRALHELGTTAAGQHRNNHAIRMFVKAIHIKRISGDVSGSATSQRALDECVRLNVEAADDPLLKTVEVAS